MSLNYYFSSISLACSNLSSCSEVAPPLTTCADDTCMSNCRQLIVCLHHWAYRFSYLQTTEGHLGAGEFTVQQIISSDQDRFWYCRWPWRAAFHVGLLLSLILWRLTDSDVTGRKAVINGVSDSCSRTLASSRLRNTANLGGVVPAIQCMANVDRKTRCRFWRKAGAESPH